MGAILGFIPTLFSILGDIPKVLSAFQFIHQAILDAEKTGEDGPTKLAAVLNDFEGFLGQVAPTWVGTFDTVAKDLEAVVTEIVAILNSFKTAAPAA